MTIASTPIADVASMHSGVENALITRGAQAEDGDPDAVNILNVISLPRNKRQPKSDAFVF